MTHNQTSVRTSILSRGKKEKKERKRERRTVSPAIRVHGCPWTSARFPSPHAPWKQGTNCSIGQWRLPLVGTVVHHAVLSGPRSERSDSELTDWLAVCLKRTACARGDVSLLDSYRRVARETHAHTRKPRVGRCTDRRAVRGSVQVCIVRVPLHMYFMQHMYVHGTLRPPW